MSVFDEDKLIDDEFLKWLGFEPSPTCVKRYFTKTYTHRYSDWGSKPATILSRIDCYYSRPNNNLYIQRDVWTDKSKKHKVYNQDDFLEALREHDLIYYKVEK